MELLWQNGQVVMQSQNQRSFKKSPPFKFHDSNQSAPREIRSSSSHYQQQQQQQQQQQSVTDHLFMQENEMASWIQYPLSDSNFDHDFCTDLLYPSSSTAAPVVAPCVTSIATTSAHPPLGRVSQDSVSAMASASRPPIPPARRNELESTRIQDFVNFSRHKMARAEQSGRSNSKSVARESTVVDSCDTPAMAPESGASQAMPSNTEAASGGDNNNACANMSAAAVANTQSVDVSVGASKDNLATCEITVTSSPGCSSASASAEPTAQKPAPAEDRKRKGREPDDAECHSKDAEFESAETKKQTRGSTYTKRSRAAEVHNLSERRRRDRINEKMRALQELIPRCNKSDKASMLDEAIEYLKSLQLQVQILTSCR